jgi:hypothetical protein
LGIYITLRSPSGEHIPFRDFPLIRLHYATEMLRFFYEGKIFVPQNIEVWLNFPEKALGGELDQNIEVSDTFKDIATMRMRLSDRNYPLDRLMSTIIVINGHWNLFDTLIPGFFSINNSPTWRGTYKDLEIDASGTGDFNDLIGVLWKREDMEGIVSSFVKKLKNAEIGQKVTPNIVFFSIGVPAKGDVDNLVGLYLKDRRALIDFLYSTLTEKGDPETKDRMPPLSRDFFIKTITEEPIVQERLNTALHDTLVIEEPVGSFTYIARDRKAFNNLYQVFSERVFKPAMQELPKVKEVELKIKKGLENVQNIG